MLGLTAKSPGRPFAHYCFFSTLFFPSFLISVQLFVSLDNQPYSRSLPPIFESQLHRFANAKIHGSDRTQTADTAAVWSITRPEATAIQHCIPAVCNAPGPSKSKGRCNGYSYHHTESSFPLRRTLRSVFRVRCLVSGRPLQPHIPPTSDVIARCEQHLKLEPPNELLRSKIASNRVLRTEP